MAAKKEIQDPQSFHLPCVGVETHAHLDFPDYADDLDQVLDRAAKCGIAWIGNIFLSIEAYRHHRPTLAQKTGLFFTLGIHPHDAGTVTEPILADMNHLFLEDHDLRALGEIGLDFYWNRSPRDAQIMAFQNQLVLARELDLPVVIHSRDAEQETLQILLDLGFAQRPLLWHCFGGGPYLARSILDQGWHISIPGPVTFPKNAALRDTAATIPLSRMVLETDCPFLTPHPLRGKRNEPAYMAYTAVEIARVRGMLPEQVWSGCAATARAFFNLPQGGGAPAP